MDRRSERKMLKQQLFTIRRFVEGERVKMTKELKDLKKMYEKLEGFTTWSNFPEKWDIGDPYGVKEGAFAFDEVTAKNYKKAKGKGYDTIIALDVPEYPGEKLDHWHLKLLEAGLTVHRVRYEKSVKNLQDGYIIVQIGAIEDMSINAHVHCVGRFGVSIHTSTPSEFEVLEVMFSSEDIHKFLSELHEKIGNQNVLIFRDALVGLELIQPSLN